MIAALVLSVWHVIQKQQLKPKPATQQSQQLPSPSVPAPAPVPSKPESAPQQNGSSGKSSESLCDRLADAFISNWPLVGIGLIGIFVAWLTLKDIHSQAKETAKATQATALAAQATQKSAEAAEKSVKLQEAALRQWLDIENWKAIPWMREGGTLSLNVQFDVVNPTDLPLTLDSVLIMFGEQGNKIDRKNLIPPKKSKPVVTTVPITEEQLLKWEDLKELNFMIGGYVQFIDALEKTQVQPFSGMIACSKKGGVRFIPPYGSGLYITDTENKSGDPN